MGGETEVVIYMGYLRFGPGEIARLKSAIEEQVIGTRAEVGCEYYSYSVDALDPDLLRIQERWVDQESIRRHHKTRHSMEFIAALQTAQIDAMRIDAYEASFMRIVAEK